MIRNKFSIHYLQQERRGINSLNQSINISKWLASKPFKNLRTTPRDTLAMGHSTQRSPTHHLFVKNDFFAYILCGWYTASGGTWQHTYNI